MSLCFEQIRNQEYRLNHVREMKKKKFFIFIIIIIFIFFFPKNWWND